MGQSHLQRVHAKFQMMRMVHQHLFWRMTLLTSKIHHYQHLDLHGCQLLFQYHQMLDRIFRVVIQNWSRNQDIFQDETDKDDKKYCRVSIVGNDVDLILCNKPKNSNSTSFIFFYFLPSHYFFLVALTYLFLS